MATTRTHWKPRKRLLLENPGVVRDIYALQKSMTVVLDRKVSLEVVVDYLLQSYRHANDREASLEFHNYSPRATKVFPKEDMGPSMPYVDHSPMDDAHRLNDDGYLKDDE